MQLARALTQHVALYRQVAIWGSKLRFSKRDPKAGPSSEIFRVRNVQMHEMHWAADRLSINRDISSALSFPTMSIVYDVWGGVTCVILCNICKSYDHRNDDSWHESLWRVAWKHGTSRNTSTATTATTAVYCFHSRWIVPVVPKSLLKLQRRWPREVQEVVLVQAMISKNLENSDMNGIGIQDS